MAESLPSLVWGCRSDGSCDYVSHQWVVYTGVPEKEQLGYGWIDRMHPDDRESVRQAWRSAIDHGARFDMELRIRSASGDYRWFKARSEPIHHAAGAIAKWYGTATEIDALKRAKEEQDQSLQRLSAIFENLSEGVVALDEHRVVTFMNRAAEQALRHTRSEIVGRKLASEFRELRTALQDGIAKVLAGGNAATFETELEIPEAPGRYRIRLHPQQSPKGVLIFFEHLVGG